MDEYLSVFGQSQLVGADQVLASLLMSFVLASLFATTYRVTFQGFSYSRAYVHTLILGSMITCMLIMSIGNNLARGLGILGTLAIIRFRTPIRDPRDMAFLFASLGVGIACGANTMHVAVVGTITICAAALLLHWSPFASRREYEGLLRFMVPANVPAETSTAIQHVLEHCCFSSHLIAMREGAQGDLLEYSYQIRLVDPSYQTELIDGLRAIEGVDDANLLMQRTTVEL